MKVKLKPFNWLLLLLQILSWTRPAQAAQCVFSQPSADYEINKAVPYAITFKPNNSVNSIVNYLRVSFTTDSGLKLPAPTCSTTLPAAFKTGSTVTCATATTAAGFDLVVSTLADSRPIYKFDVAGVVNAPSAKQVNDITCKTCVDSDCSNVKDAANVAALQFTAAPAVAGTLSVSSSSAVNGVTDATLSFQVRAVQPLLAHACVQATLPKTNQNYLALGAAAEGLITKACCGGTFTVKAFTKDSGGTSTSQPLSPHQGLLFQPKAANDGLRVCLYNPIDLPAGTTVVLEITPVTNPPSLKPISGFQAAITDENANAVEETTGIFTLSTTLPGSFPAGPGIPGAADASGVTAVTVAGGKYMVGEAGQQYDFSLYTAGAVPMGAKLFLTIPRAWLLDCNDASSLPQVACTRGCAFTNAAMLCDPVLNQLQFLQGWPSTASYTYAPGPIKFYLSGMTNPTTTTEQYFGVTTYHQDGSQYLIDRLLDTDKVLKLQFSTGVVAVTEIMPTEGMIYASTGAYNFTMSFQHPMLDTYALEITVPKTLSVLQKAGCQVVGLGPSYLCAGDASGNMITLRGLVGATTLTAGKPITFSVQQVIQNPGTFIAPGEFYFQTLTSGGGQVDKGTFVDTNATHYYGSYITAFNATISSQVAGKQPVSITFTLKPKNVVAAGAYMVLQVPAAIVPTDVAQQSRGCSATKLITGFQYEYQDCTYSASTLNMTITNGFKLLPSNDTTLEFTIPYWENPRAVTNNTGMFNITIYDSDDVELYKFNSSEGPYFVIDEIQAPHQLYYTRSSEVNGVRNNYTVSVVPKTLLEPGDLMTISLPYPVQFTEFSQCIGRSEYLVGPLDCQLSQNLQKAVFNVTYRGIPLRSSRRLSGRGLAPGDQIIPAGSLLQIFLTNISSPQSLRPASGSITYKLTTHDLYDVEAQRTGLSVANTVPGAIRSRLTDALPSFMEKGANVNYTFGFIPINFEKDMLIKIRFPSQITFKDPWNETIGCVGLNGTSHPNLTCTLDRGSNTVTVVDALSKIYIRPKKIIILFTNIINPVSNIITSSFDIETETADGYLIDRLDDKRPVFVNFFCQFPCRECNETDATQCYSCYTQATPYLYFYQDRCLAECPAGDYEAEATAKEVATCLPCKAPCTTCGTSATQCLSCIDKFILFEDEYTCYVEINWYFPYVSLAVFFFLFVILVDCCAESTNVMHSYLPFACLLEVGVWGALIWLYLNDEVEGERILSFVSFTSHLALNILFTFIHFRFMMQKASPQYLQLYKEFPRTSWFFQLMAYILNFKISLLLISNFCGRPRFGGTYNTNSWQKFNLFSALYISLVYLPFTADFYLYFIDNGLRQLTSYVALEACIIMTIIAMILMLEILQQCSCAGIAESHQGKRFGLPTDKKMSNKKKRRALRSGMGNEEGDYDDEYDSEEDEYDMEDDAGEEEASPKGKSKTITRKGSDDDDEDQDDSDASQELEKPRKGSTAKDKKNRDLEDHAQLDMLEELAKQMKDEKEALETEKTRLNKDKKKHEKEKKRQAKEYEELRAGWDKEKKNLRKAVKKLKKDKDEIVGNADAQIMDRLGKWDGNPHKDLLGQIIVELPEAVCDIVNMSHSIEGDEEYWLQNLSARDGAGAISDRSGLFREKDASVLEHIGNPSQGGVSYIQSARSMEADVLQRAGMSQGPAIGDDVSGYKSMHATEQHYVSKDGAVFGQDVGKSFVREGTQQEFIDNASAVFSQGDNMLGKSFSNNSPRKLGGTPHREKDGTDIENMESRSAAFGSVSAKEIKKSQQDFYEKTDNLGPRDLARGGRAGGPVHDAEGHSGESDEGIVADHAPFNGVQNAMARERSQISNTDSQEEERIPSGRTRRIKQVLYSDKSESSVDDMMEDTPSNYNIANGRLEGKSMGLKAILLFAKNQGIQLGANGQQPGQPGFGQPLEQINEEAGRHNSSAEDGSRQWKAMNNPLSSDKMQIVGEDKRRLPPGMNKQFKEPGETSSNSNRKNNYM